MRQCLCGQGVKGIQGHKRMEVGSPRYPTLPSELSDQSVCESSDHTTKGLHQLETRPRGNPHRRLLDQLVSPKGICVSPVQPRIQNSGEGDSREDETNPCCSSLASPALVVSSVEAPDISASSTAEQSNTAKGPDRPEEGSSNVPSVTSGRVSNLYRLFQAEGIPSNAADLHVLIAATRSSTHKTYESSWNRWCRWCSRRQIDPICASLNDILLSLTEAFNEGQAYRSLHVLRSDLSSTHDHPKIDGYSVGQHPYITRLLRGALNQRPPKPRYMVKYMVSLDRTCSLPLNVLSMKLVTLFALTCPERLLWILDTAAFIQKEFHSNSLFLERPLVQISRLKPFLHVLIRTLNSVRWIVLDIFST